MRRVYRRARDMRPLEAGFYLQRGRTPSEPLKRRNVCPGRTRQHSSSAAAPRTPSRVRVRFAPSPTGQLHLGGLRTALYNYLFAKQSGGDFILRLEDTDRSRLVPGADEHLQTILEWAGLPPDEGPRAGGSHGPYVQSQRLPTYKHHVERLLASGHAYHCFCSSERLSALREAAAKKGAPSLYDRLCAGLSSSEVSQKLSDPSVPAPVVRLRVPGGTTAFRDEIRGKVQMTNSGIDDQVLMKSDGFPTYHLAAVVDDHLMEISHVIRGEEWLPSTAKHVLLYRAFGWESPLFYHLPLLLDTNKNKLSKRRSDNVNVEDFREAGFMPEALLNFVALLGWNPGAEKENEAMSLQDMQDAFDLGRVRKSGAVVAQHKLEHVSQMHIRRLALQNPAELRRRVTLDSAAKDFDEEYVSRVLRVLADSVTTLHDFKERSRPLFVDPSLSSSTADGSPCPVRAQLWKNDGTSETVVRVTMKELQSLTESSCTDITEVEQVIKRVVEETGLGKGGVFGPLRYALTGVSKGLGIPQVIVTIGKEASLRRLSAALNSEQKRV